MRGINHFLVITIFILCGIVAASGLSPLSNANYDFSFPVAYKRIEATTSMHLTQQLKLRYIKPPKTTRSNIDRFITDYPQLANAVFLEDVFYSAPFELFERYYLNDIYLGTLFNTVHFRLRPSKKHYLQFTIPIDPWEPALTLFLRRSPAYFAYPFTWTYRWMRNIPTKTKP